MSGGEAGDAPGAPTVDVVHRDADLLIVRKPAGLPTTSPDAGDCLDRRVRDFDTTAERLHASSRLDAEVTGLVTFARSSRAIEALLTARRMGTYLRLYAGLAGPALDLADRGQWTDAIGIDPRDPRSRRVVPADAAGARLAETRFAVGARTPRATWLWLAPRTGRTHQLRVHAAAHGAALLGDRVYGGAARTVAEDGRVTAHRRVGLHCTLLSLPDVARGEGELVVHDPLAPDLAQVWRALGGDVALLEGQAARAALYGLSDMGNASG